MVRQFFGSDKIDRLFFLVLIGVCEWEVYVLKEEGSNYILILCYFFFVNLVKRLRSDRNMQFYKD